MNTIVFILLVTIRDDKMLRWWDEMRHMAHMLWRVRLLLTSWLCGRRKIICFQSARKGGVCVTDIAGSEPLVKREYHITECGLLTLSIIQKLELSQLMLMPWALCPWSSLVSDVMSFGTKSFQRVDISCHVSSVHLYCIQSNRSLHGIGPGHTSIE